MKDFNNIGKDVGGNEGDKYNCTSGEIIDTDNVTDFTDFSINNYPKYEEQTFKYKKEFAVFILTHGRAKIITTVKMLQKNGYTGDIWVVIDNEDDQEDLYRQKFGDMVIQFDKRDYVPITDLGDLDTNRKIGVFARNFIQDKAKEMGYKYHLQLDDDITEVCYRYEKNEKLSAKTSRKLNAVFEIMIEFLESTKITALSFGHPAYYVGGETNRSWKNGMIPKTMTTFFMRADDVRYFNMRMNDDITTSAINWTRGLMYYSTMPLCINTQLTQKADGGMTEVYKNSGTYRKSFYTVMALPSCAKISSIGIVEDRIHHEIRWNNCAPKLLSDKYRKTR